LILVCGSFGSLIALLVRLAFGRAGFYHGFVLVNLRRDHRRRHTLGLCAAGRYSLDPVALYPIAAELAFVGFVLGA
jgi:hypothetical protein